MSYSKKESNQRYYQKNREKIRIKLRNYYYNNKEKYRENWRKWRGKNIEKIREKQKEYYRNVRLKVLIKYSISPPECKCCQEKIIEFLTIDHIQNDGREERKRLKYKKGTHIYYRLYRNKYIPNKYQVLCMNCNFAKGKYGKCPHKLV